MIAIMYKHQYFLTTNIENCNMNVPYNNIVFSFIFSDFPFSPLTKFKGCSGGKFVSFQFLSKKITIASKYIYMDIQEVLDYINWKIENVESNYYESETFIAIKKAKKLKLNEETTAKILELEQRLKMINKSYSKNLDLNMACFDVMRDLYQLLNWY